MLGGGWNGRVGNVWRRWNSTQVHTWLVGLGVCLQETLISKDHRSFAELRVLWGSKYICWCLNVVLRKEQIKGLALCPALLTALKLSSPLHRQQAACLVKEAGVTPPRGICSWCQKCAGSQSSKSALAALLAKESLQPVPGTSYHPCKFQLCFPTWGAELLLFKHGISHELLWAGLCRTAKHLTVCVVLALAVPLVKCMYLVSKLPHHSPILL